MKFPEQKPSADTIISRKSQFIMLKSYLSKANEAPLERDREEDRLGGSRWAHFWVEVQQIKTLALTGPREATLITYQIGPNLGRPRSGQPKAMVILSKLADYGVIIATHMAAFPDRQITAAALAEATQLPQATVAKLLKAMAHAGLVMATRGATGGYRLARG